jgi:BMFP domain-containing protein YqiC
VLDQDLIKELADKILSNFNFDSTNISLFKEDLQKSLKLALQKTFSSLDLVTRQQFDIQNELLASTRAKLELLNKKIEQLEKQK